VNQDPIGLMGGTNFYQFSMNALGLIDPLGLSKKGGKAIIKRISDLRKIVKNGTSEAYNLADDTLKAPCSSCAWVLRFLRMKGKK
jgi:YD repeat protein